MKNIIRLSVLAIVLFCQLTLQAQEYKITGHIYDLQDHTPIPGAVIKSESEIIQPTISDENGFFTVLSTRQKGTLTVFMTGYKPQKVTFENERPLSIQLQSNTKLLNEVTITAFGHKSNKETAGAISKLDAQDFRKGNGVSMQDALNTVPGVKMDQSTLSDSRISIRGSGVRSPWGIRNVKVYLNDIPITEVDGTSRLEGIDVQGLGEVEIIRGPASSLYGAGTAGVMNFKLERSPYQEQSIETSGIIGSYGLKRAAATYRQSNEIMNSFISYGWQEYDGYRAHSYDKRNFLTANFQLFPSDKQLITVLVNHTAQRSQIPGALTQTQMNEDRKQAHPSNLDKQAGRNQDWTRIGLGHQYWFNKNFSNSTSVFTYFYDLDHPLPFAYLRSNYLSFGGRTKFDYRANFNVLPTQFSFGMEFNQATSNGLQYENKQGNTGEIQSNTSNKNNLYSFFLQTQTDLGKATFLTLGISYNSLNYDVVDFLNTARSGVKKFDGQPTPRAAISHNFGDYLSLHGSVSTGFSPPTNSEIQNIDGSVNPTIQAQKAVNYEVNAKGNFFKHRLNYDLALFKLDMKGELIGQTVQQGITVYENAGKTNHTGAELALSYLPIRPEDKQIIKTLVVQSAITYSSFHFKEYQTEENGELVSFNGNRLTGISPWNISAGITAETRFGLYGNVNYYFNDRFPLNDANTFYNEDWHLVNLKLGYQQALGKHFQLDIYAGINNVLNEKYSSFTALNAVGYGGEPAYFNPSPERNYYVGISFKYFIKK